MRRGGGGEGWRREGVILLIREVGAYSAMRVNSELSEGVRGWMEMEGEWDISDKRFVELVLLK